MRRHVQITSNKVISLRWREGGGGGEGVLELMAGDISPAWGGGGGCGDGSTWDGDTLWQVVGETVEGMVVLELKL
jgi:hypothetical protein